MERDSRTPLLDRPEITPTARRTRGRARAPLPEAALREIGGTGPSRGKVAPGTRPPDDDHDPDTAKTAPLAVADLHILRRRVSFEQALTAKILQGRGAASLLQCGAAELGRSVYLLDSQGSLVGLYSPTGAAEPTSPPPTPPDLDDPQGASRQLADEHGTPWHFARLHDDATGVDEGWLALGDLPAIDDCARLLLARLAEVHMLASDRRSVAWRGGLVASLLRQPARPEHRLEQARLLRLTPDGAFVVLQVSLPVDGAAAWSLLRTIAQVPHDGTIRPEIFTGEEGQPDGILFHTPTPQTSALSAAVVAIREALAAQGDDLLVAASAPIVGVGQLDGAHRQARFGLALLRAGLVPGPLVDWQADEDLGPYRPLFPLWGAGTTDDFVQVTLKNLLRRDSRQVGDLVQTMLAYVRHGGNVGGASAELGIHRNTLAYRLRQIDEATGLSPYNPAHLLSLLLAALLWTLPEPPLGATTLAAAAD